MEESKALFEPGKTIAFRPTAQSCEVLHKTAEQLRTSKVVDILNAHICAIHTPACRDNPNTHIQQIEQLNAEIKSLQSRLAIAEEAATALRVENERVWNDAWPHFAHKSGIINQLRSFKSETSAAMRMLLNRPDMRELNAAELIELMLDYCQRDPSEEFPFEPIARKIADGITQESKS